MDITHQVTPYQIEEASRFLYGVTPYYPSGTVFLVVVDPGVGTSRKAVIVKSNKGQFFVLPDNGLVSAVMERDGLAGAREIANQKWMIQAAVSSTFHGRDIFSPAAAHLAEGWDYTIAGPEVPQLVHLSPQTAKLDEKSINGEVIGLDDPFGSLVTNITREELASLGYSLGDKLTVQINKKPVTLPYVQTFMNMLSANRCCTSTRAEEWRRRQSGQLFQKVRRRPSSNDLHSEEGRNAKARSKEISHAARFAFSRAPANNRQCIAPR
jgi:S-adenosylmethionine hydrolase